MTSLPYKGHVFMLTPSPATAPAPGLDLFCGPHWLLRITLDHVPTASIRIWLDRAVELIDLLNLTSFC